MAENLELLQEVRLTPKKIDEYTPFAGKKTMKRLRELAEPLKNKRIVNINATAFGGGVSELLKTQLALLQDLGIKSEWLVTKASKHFFDITKVFHNTLQGSYTTVTDEMKEVYLKTSKKLGRTILENYDYIIFHDPQTLGLLEYINAPVGKCVWRCHIDTSEPNPNTWEFLYPYMKNFDAVIFTMQDFVKEDSDFKKLVLIPPSIDPLSPKNDFMTQEDAKRLALSYDFDPDRPIMLQVSRFDPWKDCTGVIDVYRNIKLKQAQMGIRGLQLALIGSMADDDPEAWNIYDRIMRKAGEDYDIKVLTNFHNVGDLAVKAFQYAADVVLQKSIKEGFGLTVTEAMWKAKPVIGGKTGGIKLQIEDGVNGFLVSSIEEATDRSLYLLQNRDMAIEMGLKARKTVLEKFLVTREIEDMLVLLNSL